MPLTLVLNGQQRVFSNLSPSASLQDLLKELELKGDRVAVEHNGEIVPRNEWQNCALASEDRLEVVHFVGGGSQEETSLPGGPA